LKLRLIVSGDVCRTTRPNTATPLTSVTVKLIPWRLAGPFACRAPAGHHVRALSPVMDRCRNASSSLTIRPGC